MNEGSIREFASMFQRSRILLTAFELDIFTNIDDSGTSAESISTKLNLDRHACERLMNALAALAFLEKKKDNYFNTAESFSFLSRKSDEYLGGLMHSNHLWDTWSNLSQVVRSGKAAHRDEINSRGNNWLESFITAMHDRARKQAPSQLARLDLAGTKSVLDVGGGSGAFSIELIKKKPGLIATVFDLPNVVPITNKFIDREGFTGKIKTVAGDYTRDNLPGGFDMVFLSAVIHSNPLDTNRELIKKCFKSLNSNGRIIIQDWIMNNERTFPAGGAIFAVNMLVGTEAGDCFTESEVYEILSDAGFENISRIEFESGQSQVTAFKI